MLIFISVLGILSSSHSHKYHFVNESKNWIEAQSYCIEHQNFTDLAAFYDQDDIKTVIPLTGAKAWIGLNGAWRWSLDSSVLEGDGFWGLENTTNGPTECVVMKEDGKWYKKNCEEKFPFICFDRNATKKYHCIPEAKTWDDSQSYCRANHSDLVSVRKRNGTEREEMQEELQSSKCQVCPRSKRDQDNSNKCHTESTKYPLWIGLRYGYWQWSDQSVSLLRNWATGEPNGGETNRFGVVMLPSGEWNDQSRVLSDPFICYDDELVLIRENKTWSEALKHCRDAQMDLVSVHSERVQHWVQRQARKASSPHVWLGLRFSCTLSFWFWVSGESMCYQSWAQEHGRGMDECGKTGAIPKRGQHKWEALSETERLNFICSKSADY